MSDNLNVSFTIRATAPLWLLAVVPACDPGGATLVSGDLSDEPLAGSTPEQVRDFAEGDALFEILFRESDGVGPLFIRKSCASCHARAGRGPGAVARMQVVGADGVTPVPDAPELPWGTVERPYAVGAAHTPLLAPERLLDGHHLRRSLRVGPSVLGRGYVEAVQDAEIERVAAEQAARADGIRGRVSRLGGPRPLVGRFGLKARLATLEDFTADAFQGDMGLTSPLRPAELPNPDGVTDDGKPGVDVGEQTVTAVARYVRLLEIPARRRPSAEARALFEQALCATCHVPTLRTRPDFPVAQLAGIDAPLYSDLLLHDMGADLADGLTDEGAAGPSEWRTPPLIGLRFQRSFLHDGRARTLEEAVLMHRGPGSQANVSVARFQALSPAQRAGLLEFVGGL